MPRSAFPRVFFLVALSQSLVAQTASSVSLFASPNPSTYGAAVTLTATVLPAGATGRVTFYDGVAPLGDSAVSSGQALLTTRLLSTGARSLRAHYSGDSTYGPSYSTALTQTVTSVSAASFANPASYPVSGGGGALVAGDFNGDGNADLAVLGNSFSGNSMIILMGNGDGTFQQVATYAIGFASSVAVADMNNDGTPDLITYSISGITVWIGNGDGTFTKGQTYGLVLPGSGVQVADFKGNGNVDVLTWDSNFDLQLWWGNGDGTLTQGPVVTLPENGSPQFVVADFDGDGKANIASMGIVSANSSLVVHLGNGDGTFTTVADSINASIIGDELAAGDFNNDGKTDLAIAGGGSFVSVLMGNGDGTFQPAVDYSGAPGSQIRHAAIADFDGDGKTDLAISDQSTTRSPSSRGMAMVRFNRPRLLWPPPSQGKWHWAISTVMAASTSRYPRVSGSVVFLARPPRHPQYRRSL